MNFARKSGARAYKAGVGVILCALTLPMVPAQEIHFDTGIAPNSSHAQRVTLENDSFSVEAGKRSWIELRFHIAPGLHINSHNPKDETLVPTTFKTEPLPNLHLLQIDFPAGVPYRLSTGAGETLSTYLGDLPLRLEIEVAARGEAILTGKLRYQACDNASCFPARDLPVQLTIHAR